MGGVNLDAGVAEAGARPRAWEGRERKCLGNVSEMSRLAWEGRRTRWRLGAAPFYSLGIVSEVSLKSLWSVSEVSRKCLGSVWAPSGSSSDHPASSRPGWSESRRAMQPVSDVSSKPSSIG